MFAGVWHETLVLLCSADTLHAKTLITVQYVILDFEKVGLCHVCWHLSLFAVQCIYSVMQTLLSLYSMLILHFDVQTDAELGKEIEQKFNDKMAEMKK